MDSTPKLLGLCSLVLTLLLLMCAAAVLGDTGLVWRDLALFLTGRALEIPREPNGLMDVGAAALVLLAIDVPLGLLTVILLKSLFARTDGHAVSEALETLPEDGYPFLKFFVLVVAEELLARGLFLGLFTWPFADSSLAFYAFFLIGNGLWSALHLGNFKNGQERQVLRVLPQFIGGVFFSYIFLKFGLLAAVLYHFAHNAVLFAAHKVQRLSRVDFAITGYSLFCAFASLALMKKSPAEALVWLHDPQAFALAGWGFWDYLKLAVFVGGCLDVAAGLLMYDRGNAGKKSEASLYQYVFGLPLVVGLVHGAYAVCRHLVVRASRRMLYLSIALSFAQQGRSGSAMARTFWTAIPDAFISICIFQALGFWASIAYVLVEFLIWWPKVIMIEHDD